jgi:peroxiredoxin Q/BCP
MRTALQNGANFNLPRRPALLKFLLLLAILAALAMGLLRWGGRGVVPKVGATAPDFDLPDAAGLQHRLAEYRGRWLVLYFYPKDATPICTAEACNLRDGYVAFQARNVALLGVSLDHPVSHALFAERYDLPFPLLTDADASVARAYGSLWDFGVYRIAKRHTFLIDPAGNIAMIYLDVAAGTHAQDILVDLDRLGAKIELVAPSSEANNQSIPRNP